MVWRQGLARIPTPSLGVPVKLVTAKEHLFRRWDDGRETLNIETTCNGLNCYPNSHYTKWPRSLSPEEIRSNQHLKSLISKEAFALFLSLRSSRLIHGQKNQQGAYHAMKLASQLNPKVQNYKTAAKLLKP